MHDLSTFKTRCHEKKPGCITFCTPLVIEFTYNQIAKYQRNPKNNSIAKNLGCVALRLLLRGPRILFRGFENPWLKLALRL